MKFRAKRSVHGETAQRGRKATREYRAWADMRKRCTDPKSIGWENYGGRGVRVCAEWDASFVAFRDYLLVTIGRAPTEAHTLDRVDNEKGYEPGNIRWATRTEQNNNKRIARNQWSVRVNWPSRPEFDGRLISVRQFAVRTSRSPEVLLRRLAHGWNFGDAILAPPLTPIDQRSTQCRKLL